MAAPGDYVATGEGPGGEGQGAGALHHPLGE